MACERSEKHTRCVAGNPLVSCAPDGALMCRHDVCNISWRSYNPRVFSGKSCPFSPSPRKWFVPAACLSAVAHKIELPSQAMCCSSTATSTFTFIAELRGHTRTPWTLSFHRQPHLLVSGCLSGELRLWDVRKRACVKSAVLGQDRCVEWLDIFCMLHASFS